MGIRISSQPIAAPIIASYATGVGRAQERRTDKQLDMMQQQDRLNRIEKERLADREHEMNMFKERTKIDDAREERRFERDKTLLDRRDDMYRDKDATDALTDEIRKREDFLRTSRFTPEGQKRAKLAQDSLDWLRRAREQGYRPDQMRQFYSQWINQFDNDNFSSLVETPTATWDDYAKNSQFFDENIRPISPEDVASGMVKPSYVATRDNTGRFTEPKPFGGKGGKMPGQSSTFNESYQGDEGRAKFQKDYGRTRDAIMMERQAGMKEGDAPPAAPGHDEIMKRMRDEYDMWAKETGGAPQPAPTPGAPVEPGRGQQLPQADPGSFRPPTQPLNAGQPGTPSLGPPSVQSQPAPTSDEIGWARNIVAEMQALYMDANDISGITDPGDRAELEKALRILGGQQ